jgi:RNA polymerase sigma-70 factor (ECF subfamily)
MTASRPAAALDPPDELVLRAGRGDVAAFARLVRLHNEALTRVAFAVTGDLDTAVEAAAAAWLDAWSGLHRRRSAAGVGPWLASLAAANGVVLARRHRDDGRAAPSRPGGPIDPRPADGGAQVNLALALAQLEPDDRALLALRHVAGLSTRGLVAARRWSRPPVTTRLTRLTAGLGELLAPGASDEAAESLVAQQLRAHAGVLVRPVDGDAIARRARAEAALERTRVVSVAIAGAVGVVVAIHPYLVQLAFGR